MNLFLKGYYGYKNLGDEILVFGVIKWLFENYNIDNLYIEVNDKLRFEKWLKINEFIIKQYFDKIICVQKKPNLSDLKIDLIIFGGGEVLTDQRPFPYNGWNYLLKYYKYIKDGKFVLMGGIGTPTKLFSKRLYKYIFSKVQKVIVREKKSYAITLEYTNKVLLFRDFAQDTVQYLFDSIKKIEQENILLINLNSYINNKESIKFILDIVSKYKGYKKYFVPFDIENDMLQFELLKHEIPDLDIFNWTEYSLMQIIDFFAKAKVGVGARLHFLLILYWMKKQMFPLFYQEKIKKFFDMDVSL